MLCIYSKDIKEQEFRIIDIKNKHMTFNMYT